MPFPSPSPSPFPFPFPPNPLYPQNYSQMAYRDIAGSFIPSGATVRFDSPTSSMYAYRGTQWVGYDDPSTIAIKAKYFKQQGVAGYMLWDYSEDDASLALQRAARDAWQAA